MSDEFKKAYDSLAAKMRHEHEDALEYHKKIVNGEIEAPRIMGLSEFLGHSPEKPQAREDFDKVDRALEMRVIDWLQWNEFPTPDGENYSALALQLIAKRKSAYLEVVRERDELRAKVDSEIAIYDEVVSERDRYKTGLERICAVEHADNDAALMQAIAREALGVK